MKLRRSLPESTPDSSLPDSRNVARIAIGGERVSTGWATSFLPTRESCFCQTRGCAGIKQFSSNVNCLIPALNTDEQAEKPVASRSASLRFTSLRDCSESSAGTEGEDHGPWSKISSHPAEKPDKLEVVFFPRPGQVFHQHLRSCPWP